MPRMMRVEYPGAIYPVIDPGDRRENIFVTELSKRPKNDPDKLALAARVRRETTMPIRWIAQRVQISTEKGARTTLRKWMQKEPLSTIYGLTPFKPRKGV